MLSLVRCQTTTTTVQHSSSEAALNDTGIFCDRLVYMHKDSLATDFHDV